MGVFVMTETWHSTGYSKTKDYSYSPGKLRLPLLYKFANSWAPLWWGPHRGVTVSSGITDEFALGSSSNIELCNISSSVLTGVKKFDAMAHTKCAVLVKSQLCHNVYYTSHHNITTMFDYNLTRLVTAPNWN